MLDFIAQWMIRIYYKKLKKQKQKKQPNKQKDKPAMKKILISLYHDRSYKMRLYRLYILAVL